MKTARLALAAAVAGLIASPALAGEKKDPEARLAERLDGYVAGEPVKCINMNLVRGTTIYDKTAIVFDAGSTLYVNRPENGANSLRRSDVMVLELHTNNLCDIDTIRMQDDGTGFFSGVVFLGQFVPYKKGTAEVETPAE